MAIDNGRHPSGRFQIPVHEEITGEISVVPTSYVPVIQGIIALSAIVAAVVAGLGWLDSRIASKTQPIADDVKNNFGYRFKGRRQTRRNFEEMTNADHIANLRPASATIAAGYLTAYPGDTIISSLRDIPGQAAAMASRVVENRDKKWIVETYKDSGVEEACQAAVDALTAPLSLEAVAEALTNVLQGFTPEQLHALSWHLSSDAQCDAFDLSPTRDPIRIKTLECLVADCNNAGGQARLLLVEGGQPACHVQAIRLLENAMTISNLVLHPSQQAGTTRGSRLTVKALQVFVGLAAAAFPGSPSSRASRPRSTTCPTTCPKRPVPETLAWHP